MLEGFLWAGAGGSIRERQRGLNPSTAQTQDSRAWGHLLQEFVSKQFLGLYKLLALNPH